MLWCTFIPEFWHYPVRKNIRLFKYLVCMGRMRMCSLITHYAVFLPYSNCLLQCETAIWDKSIPHHLNITISTSNDVVIYINTSNIEMCGNMNENINLKLYIQKKKRKKEGNSMSIYLSIYVEWRSYFVQCKDDPNIQHFVETSSSHMDDIHGGFLHFYSDMLDMLHM